MPLEHRNDWEYVIVPPVTATQDDVTGVRAPFDAEGTAYECPLDVCAEAEHPTCAETLATTPSTRAPVAFVSGSAAMSQTTDPEDDEVDG